MLRPLTGNRGNIALTVVLGLSLLISCLPAARAKAAPPGGSLPSLENFGVLDRVDFPDSFEAVRASDWDAAFIPHIGGDFRFGIMNRPVWIRAMLPAFPEEAHRPVLTLNSPGIKQADLYLPVRTATGIAWRHLPGSLTDRLSDLDWGYRYLVCDLPAGTAPGQWLYLRINSGGHTANFTMTLEDPRLFRQKTWLELGLLSICLGILAAMVLYNASLYLFLGDRNILLYIFYILSMAAYQLCHSGMGRVAGVPALINASIPLSALAYIFAMAFAQHFLNTRKAARTLHHVITCAMTLSAAALILSLTGQVGVANRLTHVLGILCPVIMVVAGILLIRRGYSPARYYLAAWLTLCFSIIILVLVGLRVIPYNFITYNAHALGSAAEAILLSMALGHRIQIIRKEREVLQEHERRLTRLSITDELTGLFNKRGYAAKLPLEIKLARQNQWALSLLVLDMDHFKEFNDSRGHAAGDKVLSRLGRIISRCIRDRDIPCRYGGEEFAVLLPGISMAEARSVAERLRREVENRLLPSEEDKTIACTVSIGIATLNGEDTEASFFQRADQALYMAKSQGRNRVVGV